MKLKIRHAILVIFLITSFIGFSQSMRFNLNDTNLSTGQTHRITQIRFQLGKKYLLPESYPILDSIVHFLKVNYNLTIEVSAHLDSRASDRCCDNLSQGRAQDVVDYLIQKGISVDRLISKGYGDRKLLISDEQIKKAETNDEKEALHALNRRVELKILKTNYICKDSVRLSGKVTSNIDSDKRVWGIKVKLMMWDSMAYETFCDSTGRYNFLVPFLLLTKGKLSIIATQDMKEMKRLFPGYSDCPSHLNFIYLSSEQTLKPLNEIKNVELDFKVTKIEYEIRFPCIGFKKNSVDFQNCGYDNSDTTLFCLKHDLQDNPTIIIEVAVHSWHEKKIKKLTALRGEYLLARMQSMGFDTTRIKVKLFYDTKPRISKSQIKKVKLKPEKEALEARNRRAVYKILSWDFVPRNKE